MEIPEEILESKRVENDKVFKVPSETLEIQDFESVRLSKNEVVEISDSSDSEQGNDV